MSNNTPNIMDLASLGLELLSEPLVVAPGLTLFATGSDPALSNITIPFNRQAAKTTRADILWQGGGLNLNLTGAGITVGVWDEGNVRSTHQELTGRITNLDGGILSNHATHVAGTIGATGIVTAARGMAYEALIRSRDWNNDFNELRADANLIQLSNHSYGFATGWNGTVWVGGAFTDMWFEDRSIFSQEDPDFGRYSIEAQELDRVLYDNPALLSIWAAGNDRNDRFTDARGTGEYFAYLSSPPAGGQAGWYLIDPATSGLAAPQPDGNGGTGYDSLSPVQTAKNSLVVGAIDDVTWTGSNAIATGGATLPFSSWGLADDGRLKIDLVANGDALFSPIATGDTNYANFSGTSMAAPNVTGTMALLYEHHNNLKGNSNYRNVIDLEGDNNPRFKDINKPSSATMKGLAIHTATDLGNPGPDYTFGWGLLNAQNAAKFLSNLATKSKKHLLAEDTFNGTDLNLGKISSHGGDIKATLIWTDPAPTTVPSRGVNDATIDDSTSVLVNDLDLWLEDSQGNKYYPWTLDPSNPSANAVKTKANRLDNIEQIVFNADSDGIGAGEYTVHVGGTLDPGYTAQDFSIFLTSVPKIGEGHCWGDVHHVTFDGKPYDLQSVGEFILVKSTVDDWQIQTRQEAWRDSTRVSINTAFATEMEGFNIVFDVDFVPNQRLRIDGINYTLTSGQSLDLGNSQIQRQGSEYTLIYAGLDGIIGTSDDDRVLARDRGNRIDIYVDPADYRATFLQGLLGNADGDISNDLALRDGTVLFDPNFQQIHGEYADSWRISQSESLFGTPTFADLNFPVSPISLQDFDEATRNAALQAARAAGIPEGFALEAAALDFAVTGDIDFIDGAAAIFAQSISLDLSPDRVSENETANLVYTFTRTGNLDSALTVNFSIGGTATANLDYSQSGASQFTETAGTITFAEGESTATLILDPIADTTPEGDENVILTLAAGTGYTIDTTAAVTGTLLNFNHPALIEGTATADLTEDADDPNLTATGNLTVTDLDTGEDQFNTTVTSAPDNLGTLTISETGTFNYSVANSAVQYLGAEQTKLETFTVESFDGTASQEIAVTITGVNDAPIASDDQQTTTENAAISNNVLSNDSDIDVGDLLTVTKVNGIAQGLGQPISLFSGALLTLNTDGTYLYDPNGQFQFLGENETYLDGFAYTIGDGQGGISNATVEIAIAGVNDTAIIGGTTTASLTEDASNPNLTATGDLTIADADRGEDRFNTTVASSPDNLGLLSITETGTFNYSVENSAVQDLGAGQTKTETFTVESFDGSASQEITITLLGVNDAPIAVRDRTTTAQNTPVTLSTSTLLANDRDIDSPDTSLSVVEVSNETNGTAVLNDNNTPDDAADDFIVFTPTNDFSGNARFDYTLSDGSLTDTTTVTIGVGQNIDGTDDDDLLLGTIGDDVINGLDGTDWIDGSFGDDLLNGGNGDDLLDGGWGRDTFVLAMNSGVDTIADFRVSQGDRMGLAGGLMFGQLAFSGEEILVGNQTLAVVSGFDTTTLTADNFVTI